MISRHWDRVILSDKTRGLVIICFEWRGQRWESNSKSISRNWHWEMGPIRKEISRYRKRKRNVEEKKKKQIFFFTFSRPLKSGNRTRQEIRTNLRLFPEGNERGSNVEDLRIYMTLLISIASKTPYPGFWCWRDWNRKVVYLFEKKMFTLFFSSSGGTQACVIMIPVNSSLELSLISKDTSTHSLWNEST